MRVLVKPRLQVENWSLYWKESLKTSTECLEPIELDLPEEAGAAGGVSGEAASRVAGPTAADLLCATAAALGWQPVGSLIKLDGFSGPWERVLVRGRELAPTQSLREATSAPAAKVVAPEAAAGPMTVTVVRIVLKADGWKIRQAGDFLSDSDDDM
ncbi:hypothetical protein GPECTOR_299g809 [Gonium pectorale]|uniref:Uncharacterized protein n=1 Tax=Gonium pectorale TaxID=33097 RepID=A0A150FVV1_GONPE|nr:hypothetical protein GPECTOR_299g809 [Gonium pectorale]|eukprot:KXZ41739.1 hypothetical protein GPECTOR_299g809 [Gonium pectorale]